MSPYTLTPCCGRDTTWESRQTTHVLRACLRVWSMKMLSCKGFTETRCLEQQTANGLLIMFCRCFMDGAIYRGDIRRSVRCMKFSAETRYIPTWSFVGDIPFTIRARLTRTLSWATSRERVAVPLSASSVARSLTLCWASFRPVPYNDTRFRHGWPDRACVVFD